MDTHIVKVPGVQKGVEKALQKKVSGTPLEETPDVLSEDESDMKPLTVPKMIPTENVTGTGVCSGNEAFNIKTCFY